MRIPVDKVIAHRATSYANAHWMWNDFIKENKQAVLDCNKHDFFRTRTISGEVHYFVPISSWNEWTRGRTYWLDDELYHSGYKVTGE